MDLNNHTGVRVNNMQGRVDRKNESSSVLPDVDNTRSFHGLVVRETAWVCEARDPTSYWR